MGKKKLIFSNCSAKSHLGRLRRDDVLKKKGKVGVCVDLSQSLQEALYATFWRCGGAFHGITFVVCFFLLLVHQRFSQSLA
jgi:hypothetical protein